MGSAYEGMGGLQKRLVQSAWCHPFLKGRQIKVYRADSDFPNADSASLDPTWTLAVDIGDTSRDIPVLRLVHPRCWGAPTVMPMSRRTRCRATWAFRPDVGRCGPGVPLGVPR